MHRWIGIVLVVGLLSACASSVKLDESTVHVEDKSGKTVVLDSGDKSGSAALIVDPSLELGNKQTSATLAAQNAQRTVYFDYDSAAIRGEFQPILELHAQVLKTDQNNKVFLEGHTDERGGREYNLALGQRRADAVKRSLVLLGVAEEQLEAISFGKEKPALLGSTEEVMAKNRRVEIRYK